MTNKGYVSLNPNTINQSINLIWVCTASYPFGGPQTKLGENTSSIICMLRLVMYFSTFDFV